MEKKFQYEGSDIYYTVAGYGPPLVLLHGFAEDGTVWNEQLNFLKEHCMLIIPDLPGSGKSSLLRKQSVAIEDYAACISALLQAENIDRCIFLGHSMGGYVTLAFAELYADKLAGFGFVHSTAFADDEDKKNSRRKGIKLIDEYGAYAFIKNSTPNLFTNHYKHEHGDKVAGLVEQGKNFRKEALIQYYTAMMNRPNRTDVLQKSEVPVLFIAGSDDVAAPLDDLLKQVHLPKISFIHIIDGVGHMGMWEKPEQVNSFILEFLKRCCTFE